MLLTERFLPNLQRAAVERLRLVVLALCFEKPLQVEHMLWNAKLQD